MVQLRIIQGETRSTFYGIILGTWLLVAIYAMAHDQYLVAIAPQHFTDYHSNPFSIQSPRLLALVLSFGASFSPGLALGIASYFVARAGSRPKVAAQTVLKGTCVVIAATELTAAAAGLVAYTRNAPVFPTSFYPESSPEIYASQTIQLVCYLAAACYSMLLLGWMRLRRGRGC